MLIENRVDRKNTRIALMVRSFEGGGAERVMVILSNKFMELGYSVDFIVINDRGPFKKDLGLDANLITLNKNGNHKNAVFSVVFNLLKYFIKTPPAVLMATPKRTNVIALFAKLISLKKFPLFVREATTFDWFYSNMGFQNKLLIAMMRCLYPRSTGVFANSYKTRQEVIRQLHINSEKVHVIYNPLDLSKFCYKRSATSTKPQKIIIGCGRLDRGKNFGDLIRCFPAVVEHYANAQLLILGEGVERERLADQIERVGLTGSVHLLGFVENPYEYFALADVFVQTSLWEGFGYVLAEAMACGTPVVAYDSKGAMREILENGKYGKLVHVGDIKALGYAIIDQIEKPTSKRLLHEAVKRFDVDIISKQYLNTMLQGRGEMCPDRGN